jgi:pimeloyl-ACP methyl ester carboxylesterase
MSQASAALTPTATGSLKCRLLRLAKRWAKILAVTYLLACLLLYTFQTMLIFPGASSQGTADARVDPPPRSELIHLTTQSGEKTVALFGKALLPNGTVDPTASTKPTVLFFYCNGMYLSVTLAQFAMFRDAGANCLAVEYLGYGMAEGKPSEAGCYAAAEAGWQYLLTRTDIDTHKLIPAGWSLGGAVAIDLAQKHKDDGRIVGLATFCTFTSMPDVAHYHYPIFPTGLVLKHRFDSAKKLPDITVPHLLGHGKRDNLIPFTHADKLATLSHSSKLTRFTAPDASHNDFFELAEKDLTPVLKEWLKQF